MVGFRSRLGFISYRTDRHERKSQKQYECKIFGIFGSYSGSGLISWIWYTVRYFTAGAYNRPCSFLPTWRINRFLLSVPGSLGEPRLPTRVPENPSFIWASPVEEKRKVKKFSFLILWTDLTKVISIPTRGPRTDMAQPGIEPGPPWWEASTLEKSYSNCLLIVIRNIYIWSCDNTVFY